MAQKFYITIGNSTEIKGKVYYENQYVANIHLIDSVFIKGDTYRISVKRNDDVLHYKDFQGNGSSILETDINFSIPELENYYTDTVHSVECDMSVTNTTASAELGTGKITVYEPVHSSDDNPPVYVPDAVDRADNSIITVGNGIWQVQTRDQWVGNVFDTWINDLTDLGENISDSDSIALYNASESDSRQTTFSQIWNWIDANLPVHDADNIRSILEEGNAVTLTKYDSSGDGNDDTITIAVDESAIDHNNLTNSGDPDAHHTKYTDSEAQNTVRNNVLIDTLQPAADNTDLDATQSVHGLMPKADKIKLDGIPSDADNTSASDVGDAVESGDNIAAPSDPDLFGIVVNGILKNIKWSDLENSVDHSNINITSDDHHTRYTDSEAQTAVNNDADHGSTASHNYYTDADAEDAINNDADHGSTASHNYYTDADARDAAVDDTAFESSWDGVTDTAPSKDSVYDELSQAYTSDSEVQAAIDNTVRTLTQLILTGNAPLDMVAESSPPSEPSEGSTYLDDGSNTQSGIVGWRYYNGSSWIDISAIDTDGTTQDHGQLNGLTDDDHIQYHNDSKADTWHNNLTGDHVTNGNSHDHSGGDGAQIDHGDLAGRGSYNHTDIDNHIDSNDFHNTTYMNGGTTDDTVTELFDNEGTRYILNDGEAVSFKIVINAKKTDNTALATFTRTGLIINNGGTTALEDSVIVPVPDINNPGWDVKVDADDTNNSLRIQVEGAVGTEIDWVAYIEGYTIN